MSVQREWEVLPPVGPESDWFAVPSPFLGRLGNPKQGKGSFGPLVFQLATQGRGAKVFADNSQAS